ncbi:otolith matrix protein OMM-64-like isoform X1 [Ostrinia furnacalis]|uniref:otolith matrix protein OMM-64-like isoform X1 n=1 Tax=Ostrinia furnacalis TaxID=93504 RepID=UPI00103B5A2F|nr:otolith matrix protein OMM-64-like isoform X1 [Ostrinia furnacalis]
MRITLALTVLLISQVVAEDKDAQDATEAEVKSANTEAAQTAEEVNREAESYTVPVEVVGDAVTESEAVRKADEHKEEQERIERATTGDVDFDDYADLKLSEDEKLFSETEHVNNRRSNDETPKSAKEDAEVKTAESDKASEKKAEEDQAETKTVSEDDDLSKKGEEVEKKGSEVKRADDAAAEEKSAVKVKSADEDKIEDTEKAAKSDDVSSLVSESESDFKLSTRRMSNPLETLVETKARAGDKSRSQASFSDESSAIFGSGDFSKAAEPFRSSFASDILRVKRFFRL